MVTRKQIEIERFIETINREWSLSINEEMVLDSFLNLFLAGKNTEIKKVEHLLNDETEQLLELLNDREVIDYAIDLGGFIASDDESGLEDALDDLNFNWIEKVSDEDMIKSLEDDGWSVEFGKDYPIHQNDIITQYGLEEMTELFLSADFNKRQEVINNLKL